MADQTALKEQVAPMSDVKLIGIYGLPGCGKTKLIGVLKSFLPGDKFEFFEGSEVIDSLVDGGLERFKTLPPPKQRAWREQAIEYIQHRCAQSGKGAIVAGHFMFWNDNIGPEPAPICTEKDKEAYTHILYLDVDPEVIVQRRRDDPTRGRPALPVSHIRRWQDGEKTLLRQMCYENDILFTRIASHAMSDSNTNDETLRFVATLTDFCTHTEIINKRTVETRLDEIIAKLPSTVETLLVFDADKTLASVDASDLFFDQQGDASPLKPLFKTKLYTYSAFRQAMLLFEQDHTNKEFHARCEEVALQITLSDEIKELLSEAQKHEHIGVVIVTCGLSLVWEKVLRDAELSIPVKGDLVARLQGHHGLRVIAFGDSEMDLPMLKKADQAVVVVGEEEHRSKSMDRVLQEAINDGLEVTQARIPATASLRLAGTDHQPAEVVLGSKSFIDPITKQRMPTILHATDKNVAKLMQTAMRDASIFGPVLREAHRRVGYYLATEYLTEVLGLEECDIMHVQGNKTKGHRLSDEQKTVIVAIMRGGEPMAFGVSEAFPAAMFVHAKEPEQLDPKYLANQSTVILVDSVINSGKSIKDFADHVREVNPKLRVVVVAGVAQAGAVQAGGVVWKLALAENFSVVALRLSDNKYTGHKATDTGDRLFNTTQVD
ncbi:hypothetical protein LTR56_011103 [Elasticomyces elasticus]|nr:hypothetical protein LTR56_011103 [Elasticomyces elasticus]KAK3662476.1 hypothetical protein LTR22_006755 [Elasticomyces elasticus]KAK4926465.1 hypothetical protein LTR49_006672 [Elasticomyces elasticus]KAK5761161.1 hypothetical protein LTS12_008642 [Elasticomyces elasticus]